jgi:hypothetical protein
MNSRKGAKSCGNLIVMIITQVWVMISQQGTKEKIWKLQQVALKPKSELSTYKNTC